MADWGSLLEGASPNRSADLHGIKRALPVEWVLGRKGVLLEPTGDGRLVALCPFHEDENANFAVFTQPGDELPLSRVGCWVCDFKNGDIYDFLQRFLQVPQAQAVQHAAELLSEFRADAAWKSQGGDQAANSRPKADPADLLAIARQASAAASVDATAILRLIDEKANVRGEAGWSLLTADFLRTHWHVGVEDDWTLVVPHLSRDELGQPQVRGIKTRSARSHLIARKGSDLAHLYGEFQARGHKRVLLVEGESDAWCASAALWGQDVDVLALPSGASAYPKDAWVAMLADRDVVIAFDGDRAGRVAARKWWFKLSHLQAHAPASLKFATLPDGKDLSTVPNLLRVVMEAGPVPPSVGNVSRDPERGVYVRTVPGRAEDAPDVETVISNWSLDPLRELTLEDGSRAYEGMVNGRDVLLQSHNLRSDASTKAWAETIGGNWLGSSRDSACLLGNLQNEGPFLGRGRATSVLGWHDGQFVLPDGYIGPDYWRYIPPAASLSAKGLRLAPGNWDPACLDLMLRLRRPEIMHPIISWLFAAPLRSTFDVFPFLAVTGQSGSGKTTLIGTMLDKLGWKIHTTITGTTPHAILASVGMTNGLPVWFDEYRPGSREESKRALDQVLRDAYDRSPTKKGGGSDKNPLAIVEMPTEAPIVVTGEDAFTETSHIERMVWVKLDRADKNRADLEALLATQTDGLGYAYLQWLVEGNQAQALPSLRVNTTIDRQTTNRQILEVGWELFRAFYQAATGGDVGRPQLGAYLANVSEVTDPVTEAMIWAQGQTAYGSTEPVVHVQGDDVIVQLESFVQAVNRSGVFVLPGGPAAIANILEANWGAFKRVNPLTRQRQYVLPGAAGKLLEATVPTAE